MHQNTKVNVLYVRLYLAINGILIVKLFLYCQDRDALSLKLEDTENWLYEDGEDQSKQVYIDKLAEIKVISAIIIALLSHN